MNSPRVAAEMRLTTLIRQRLAVLSGVRGGVRIASVMPACRFLFGCALILAPSAYGQTLQTRDADIAKAKDISASANTTKATGDKSASSTPSDTSPQPSASLIEQQLETLKKQINALEGQLKSLASEQPAAAEVGPNSDAAPTPTNTGPTAPSAAVPNGGGAPSAQTPTLSAIAASPGSADESDSTSSSEGDSVVTASADSAENGNVVPSKTFLGGLRRVLGVPQTQPGAPPPPKDIDPFSLYDYTWMNGNSRNTDTPLATKYFSPEFRVDTMYAIDGNHPSDHTLGGSTETFESGEVQVEQLSFGGDLRVGNVRGRVLTMFGQWAATTPRNDASPSTSSWDLDQAYRYVSEAWGGYHLNVNHNGGLNIDAGIFVSYIGLFSYYNFDNWTYQPSYVSSNTPWFFNGVRIQYFPSSKLKIEPWFINGWQSYAKANGEPGLGGQILWRPTGWFSLVANNYGFGHDVPNILAQPGNVPVFQGSTAGISRMHTDDSIEMKLYDKPMNMGFDKFAFSLTGDLGCQSGGTGTQQVSCVGEHGVPKSTFLGFMEYNRFWFHKDLFAITLGGGEMSNPGRYLTLLPPINGATAITGTPYFTENPGQQAKMWDTTFTFDYMPAQFITFRFEAGYRWSDIPYWTGPGGITPPGGDNGSPQFFTCANGVTSGSSSLTGPGSAEAVCPGITGLTSGPAIKSVWFPDLVQGQMVGSMAIMVKF